MPAAPPPATVRATGIREQGRPGPARNEGHGTAIYMPVQMTLRRIAEDNCSKPSTQMRMAMMMVSASS